MLLPALTIGYLLSKKMTVSGFGKNLIKQFETLRLKAYPDSKGYSIGYGHYIKEGDGLTKDSIITIEQAEKLFSQDVAEVYEAIVSTVKVKLSQNQTDALASFVYNIGVDAFKRSTLVKILNTGDYVGAADQFDRWVHSNKKVLPSLIARRAAEKALFLK